MLNRRHLLASSAASLLPALWPSLGNAQARKNQLTLAMALEPPVLDPTASAASAIGEVVLYNLFETLTKITPEGTAQPLLAQRWQASTDLKTYRFHLRQDVQFHNGVAFDADTVRFSLERAAGADSTNKDKATWAQLRVQVIDRFTVDLHSPQPQPDLPFLLGQATAIMVEPSSAATNAQQPVGTGPYRVQQWRKGSSITLLAWPGYREAGRIRIQRATFRFIPDAAAQVGIQVKLVNVEWAQWLSGTYGQKQYDLSLISHVEPLDLGNYAKPDYYWGYQSPAFQALYAQLQSTSDPEARLQLLAQAQRMLAEDCVNVFLYQPQWVTIANAQLRGLWAQMPLPVNDLSTLYWQ